MARHRDEPAGREHLLAEPPTGRHALPAPEVTAPNPVVIPAPPTNSPAASPASVLWVQVSPTEWEVRKGESPDDRNYFVAAWAGGWNQVGGARTLTKAEADALLTYCRNLEPETVFTIARLVEP